MQNSELTGRAIRPAGQLGWKYSYILSFIIMHAPLPAVTTYIYTVFICCFVIFHTVALWYYKP